MNVKELKEQLADLPDDMEVLFRRIAPITGNVEYAGRAVRSEYGFFGKAIPCVIIEPMSDDDNTANARLDRQEEAR